MYRISLLSGVFYAKELRYGIEDDIENIEEFANEGTIVVLCENLEEFKNAFDINTEEIEVVE